MDVREKPSSKNRLIDYYYLAEKIECPGEPLVYWYDIEAAPTIDAVPVVRCRECKYSRINHLMKKDILSCENIDVCGEEYLFERNPNDFCSYGERKEGAD